MLKDKTNPPSDFKAFERPGEKIEGGFIVVRKGRWGKRLKFSDRPFEHPTYDSADKELKKLQERYPESSFTILIDASKVKSLIGA